jgi:hypothetical protein
MAEESDATGATGFAGHAGRWLALVSALLTVVLTGLNAYWSREINRVDADLRVREAELKREQLALDEGKERMARYAFVHSLFDGVLNQNPAQKTLTINLVNLALTTDEAQKLFTGLEASNDAAARDVGTLGSDVVALTSLISRMNDAARESRVGAVDDLIRNHGASGAAVQQALGMLEPPRLDGLTAAGRINVLVFLRNTQATAWTAQDVARARQAIAEIRRRAKESGIAIGGQTDEALTRLSAHIDGLKR